MNPILEKGTIGQIRQSIVLRQMRHFYTDSSGNRHVMENDDGPGSDSLPVMNWRSRVINRKFSAVATTEDAIWRKSDGLVFLDCRPRRAVDDYKYLFNGPTCRLYLSPTGDLFRYAVELRNSPLIIGTQDGVTNGIEGDLSTLLFDEQGFFGSLPLCHIAYGTNERISVELVLSRR
jgi:hypothetical protein